MQVAVDPEEAKKITVGNPLRPRGIHIFSYHSDDYGESMPFAWPCNNDVNASCLSRCNTFSVTESTHATIMLSWHFITLKWDFFDGIN